MRFQDIIHAPLGMGIRGFSALLLLGQIYICQRLIHQRRSPRMLLFSFFNALAGALLFCIMIGDLQRPAYGLSLRFHEFELRMYLWPWWIYPAAEAILVLFWCLFILNIRRYAQSYVTMSTIKEAVDLLPAGICFGNVQGEVLLSNPCMNDLCFALTGRPLQDTKAFWEAVVKEGEAQEGQYLLRMEDGTAMLVSKSSVTMGERSYDQFIASDMTEQTRISDALRAKNAELWRVQYRMKAYRARAAKMFMEEELLSARTEVHDGLGHILLMGRYYLDHPEKTDEAELKRLLCASTVTLMSEADASASPRDFYAEALRRIERFGIRVETDGIVPPYGKGRNLIGHALGECAANAAKHAGAQCVHLSIEEAANELRVSLTNDGEAPREPVREIGGLRTLRRLTEDAGGRMTINSSPRFHLTLYLPMERQTHYNDTALF